MSTVELFSPDANFWECNQQFKIANPFKRLYEKDRSRNKKESSMMMWFISFVYDMNSRYYNLPEDERIAVICEDYMNDSDYYEDNKEDIEVLAEAFINLQDTPARRALRDWELKIQQRAKFIRETDYTLDYYEEDAKGKLITKKGTADQLDRMMGNTKKLFDDYQRILKDLSTEEAEDGVMGGEMESLID